MLSHPNIVFFSNALMHTFHKYFCRMNRCLLLIFIIMPFVGFTQPFHVHKGDTINRTDASGKKQGLWRKYYRSDSLYSETVFKDDKPVGTARTWYETGGLKAEVSFGKNGRGKGISYFEDGKKMASGNYLGTVKDSTWVYWHEKADTISAIENYKSGKPEGRWQVFYETGILAHEVPYVNGKKHGTVKQYNEDGRLIFEINYVNGVEEGPSTLYYTNGSVREKGIYKNGERDGSWKLFDDKGAVQGEIVYKNGVEISKSGITGSE